MFPGRRCSRGSSALRPADRYRASRSSRLASLLLGLLLVLCGSWFVYVRLHMLLRLPGLLRQCYRPSIWVNAPLSPLLFVNDPVLRLLLFVGLSGGEAKPVLPLHPQWNVHRGDFAVSEVPRSPASLPTGFAPAHQSGKTTQSQSHDLADPERKIIRITM